MWLTQHQSLAVQLPSQVLSSPPCCILHGPLCCFFCYCKIRLYSQICNVQAIGLKNECNKKTLCGPDAVWIWFLKCSDLLLSHQPFIPSPFSLQPRQPCPWSHQMELQISGTALGATATSDPPALGRDSLPHTGDALPPVSVTSCFPVLWSPKAHRAWVRGWSVHEWLW